MLEIKGAKNVVVRLMEPTIYLSLHSRVLEAARQTI